MFNYFKRKRGKENLSVLNIDSFDKRRFEQIFQSSKSLQLLEQDEEIPLFKELLRDIWASLYKASPKIREKIDNPELIPNKFIVEKVMSNELYTKYHKMTQFDDVLSAMGAIMFGEKINEWLDEMKEENERLDELMDQIENLSRQMEENMNGNGIGKEEDGHDDESAQSKEQMQQNMNEMMMQLAHELQQAMDNNHSPFSQIVASSFEGAKETSDNLKKLLSDIGGKMVGSESGTFQKLPLRNKLELAEELAQNKKLKEIAEWAGKFTRIAKSKQKSTKDDTIGVGGIQLGDSLERILPTEVMLYANELTRGEFFKKHSERTLMQYKPRTKEKLGKGSIVLCLDQSGSMEEIEEQAKGFALAIMAIARKQKRNFAYIPFDGSVGKVRTFPKGKINPYELIEIATGFLGGGTNFESPLNVALDIINRDKFKEADIIFVTDGISTVSENFLKQFQERKKEKRFQVLSLVLDSDDTNVVKKFSDKIIVAKNFSDEKTYEIFEI